MPIGLVLAGGAARGAYQSGVLRFLLADLPKRYGRTPWPTVVSGTSAGALNAVSVAARDLNGIRRASQLWQTLTVDRVLQLKAGEAFRLAAAPFRTSQAFSMVDSRPLARLVHEWFPERELRQAIGSGKTRAFIVSATDLASGYNALFVDSADPSFQLGAHPNVVAQHGPITMRHLLASAAIPALFPPVRIQGRPYVDGGLRQNTPLRPVLRGGVNRAIVISLRAPAPRPDLTDASPLVPSLPVLTGKTLNALMLDPVLRDLHTANQTNALIDWGRQTYGPGFAEELEIRLGLRHVDILHIQPSEDLAAMAKTIFESSPPRVPPLVRRMLAFTAAGDDGDMLSYLYFDRSYTGALEDLGFEDARRREDEIIAFLEGAHSHAAAH